MLASRLSAVLRRPNCVLVSARCVPARPGSVRFCFLPRSAFTASSSYAGRSSPIRGFCGPKLRSRLSAVRPASRLCWFRVSPRFCGVKIAFSPQRGASQRASAPFGSVSHRALRSPLPAVTRAAPRRAVAAAAQNCALASAPRGVRVDYAGFAPLRGSAVSKLRSRVSAVRPSASRRRSVLFLLEKYLTLPAISTTSSTSSATSYYHYYHYYYYYDYDY